MNDLDANEYAGPRNHEATGPDFGRGRRTMIA
jgi:hypothetical protein